MSVMRALPVLVLLALAACRAGDPVLPGGVVVGTWGGDNAGVIGSDSVAHVHIGCESGYTDGPVSVDHAGRFSVPGSFTVGAYPIGPGTTHPATFSGRVLGRVMVLTVELGDTARSFGPVAVEFGEEPRMDPCPICATANRRDARRMLSSGPHVDAGDPQPGFRSRPSS